MIEPTTPLPASRRLPVRLLLFGLLAIGSVAVGFLFFDANEARLYVQRFGYYSISLTFAWAVVALFRIRTAAVTQIASIAPRECWQAFGIAIGCLLLAVATVPTVYKVLY